jgi:hypothetical protein
MAINWTDPRPQSTSHHHHHHHQLIIQTDDLRKVGCCRFVTTGREMMVMATATPKDRGESEIIVGVAEDIDGRMGEQYETLLRCGKEALALLKSVTFNGRHYMPHIFHLQLEPPHVPFVGDSGFMSVFTAMASAMHKFEVDMSYVVSARVRLENTCGAFFPSHKTCS